MFYLGSDKSNLNYFILVDIHKIYSINFEISSVRSKLVIINVNHLQQTF